MASPAQAEPLGPEPDEQRPESAFARALRAWLRVSPRIEWDPDGADLAWYFASGGHDRFSPSASGKMWERAQMFASRARPCVRCGGDPIAWTGGLGFEPPKPPKDQGNVRTPKRRRSGAITSEDIARLLDLQPELAAFEHKLAAEGLAALSKRICRDCKGKGWRVTKPTSGHKALTARPTGSSVRGTTERAIVIVPDDMARLGRVARRLDRATAINPMAPLVLTYFYGDGGGNLLALYSLVPAGRTMLRRSGSRLVPSQFFANELMIQERKPEGNRAAQLALAEKQARELFRNVGYAWNYGGLKLDDLPSVGLSWRN